MCSAPGASQWLVFPHANRRAVAPGADHSHDGKQPMSTKHYRPEDVTLTLPYYDDVLDESKTITPKQRERLLEWWDETMDRRGSGNDVMHVTRGVLIGIHAVHYPTTWLGVIMQAARPFIVGAHVFRYGRSPGEGADLRGAYLQVANLTDTNLSGANLDGADLTDANLRGADLEGAVR